MKVASSSNYIQFPLIVRLRALLVAPNDCVCFYGIMKINKLQYRMKFIQEWMYIWNRKIILQKNLINLLRLKNNFFFNQNGMDDICIFIQNFKIRLIWRWQNEPQMNTYTRIFNKKKIHQPILLHTAFILVRYKSCKFHFFPLFFFCVVYIQFSLAWQK